MAAPLPHVAAPALLVGDASTTAFAQAFAPSLMPGDVVLLDGPVGAGKTAFVRAVITELRRRSDLPPEDVPSPTFTLVQTYDVSGIELWHADLYRVSDGDEVAELGLYEAFETGICFVEWPDRLGSGAPAAALTLRLDHAGPDARSATLSGRGRLYAAAAQALRGVAQ